MIETVNQSDFSLNELAHGTDRYLPKWRDIPKIFKNDQTCWNLLYNIWDRKGIDKVKLFEKPSVIKAKAIMFLAAHISSRKGSKKIREAGVAYLMSELFKSFIVEDRVYNR